MGNRPATRPPVLLDTLDDNPDVVEEVCEEMSDDEEAENVEERSIDNSGSAEGLDVELGSISATQTDHGHTEPSSRMSEACGKSSSIKGKKQKRSKGEVIEQVVTKVMKTVTEEMKESNKLSIRWQ